MEVSMLEKIGNAALFVQFAAGPSWVFCNALYLEVPYLQQHQPEELCLASWMSVALLFSTVVVWMFYLYDLYICRLDLDVSVTMTLVAVPMLCLIASFYVERTIDGRSWPLLILAFLSGVVGTFQYQTLFPLLTRYLEEYTIISRSAGDIMSLFVSFFVFYQNPGSRDIKFGTGIFFFWLAIYFLVFPTTCYAYIYFNNVGLKDEDQLNKTERKTVGGTVDEEAKDGEKAGLLMEGESVEEEGQVSASERGGGDIDKVMGADERDFDAELMIYTLCSCWLDFNNWGLIQSLYPFAFSNNTYSLEESSIYQSYTNNIGSLAVLLGGLSAYFIRIPLHFTMSVFTIMLFVIYIAAYIPFLKGEAWVLVLFADLCMFITIHVQCVIFNIISEEFPASRRVDDVKWIGISTSFAVVAGSILGIIITEFFFHCFSAHMLAWL